MVLMFYRVGNFLHRLRVPLIPKLMTLAGRLFFGCYIDSRATIGKGTKIAYGGSGVVIHGSAVIGINCVIAPGVVIGGRQGQRAPTVQDSVKIYSNASVLGDITLGQGSTIGSNVVVTENVNPFEVLVVQKPRRL
jgi:serine O-acetyltransferase